MLSTTQSLKKIVDQKAMQGNEKALRRIELNIQNSVVDGLKGLKYAQECGSMPVNTKINSIPYEQRILDAFARLCHINSKLACAAVMLQGQELIVSYNFTAGSKHNDNDIVTVNRAITELKNKVFNQNISSDELVNYLLKSKHAFYFPEGYKEIFDKDKWGKEVDSYNAINTKTKQIIKDFFALSLVAPSNKNELIESIDTIKSQYQSIIELFSQNDCSDVLELLSSAQSRMLYFRERLLQDCTKIKEHFENSCLNGEKQLTILDNPNNRHAEVHLLEQAKDSYVGISKLSCYLCQSVFNHYEIQNSSILHLGGSGIVYPVDKAQVPDIMCHDSNLFSAFLKIVISTNTTCDDQSTGISCDPAGQYPQVSPTFEDLVTPWPPVQIVGADNNATADL